MALLLRAILWERKFAHVLDGGGMRRAWLRGRDDVAKRYFRADVARGPEDPTTGVGLAAPAAITVVTLAPNERP